MKFTTAVIAASAAALVSASPIGASTDAEIKAGDRFRIMSIRSGSDLQYGQMQAALSGFFVNTPQQNASCLGGTDVNYATFFLTEAGELYLNTEKPYQQTYVDRSGMGQGAFRFTTGAEGAGRNSERTGFTIDSNSNLVFRDQTNQDIGFKACPSKKFGGYDVWLNIVQSPAGLENCVGFTARALKEDDAVECSYSHFSEAL